MSAPPRLDLNVAIEQLRSHDLQALFTQTLGWKKPSPATDSATDSAPNSTPNSIELFQQPCIPIAHRHAVTVWLVSLTVKTPFTADLRQRIYTAIEQTSDTPLVIFVDAAKTRSLWCQSAQESALYVTGQPTTLWQFRLHRFAQSTQGLFSSLSLTAPENNYAAFEALLTGLYEGITGISNTTDRKAYAMLTLQRLIFVQSVQQHGWMDTDTWYLQNRFGAAQQQGKNLFFETCLQPLYKSLTLPAVERPLSMQAHIGDVPFLNHLFNNHRIEEQYDTIAISDQPFEEILGWLSEQASTEALNPWVSAELGYLLERYWAQQEQPKTEYIVTPALTREISQQTLERFLLNRLIEQSKATEITLNDILFNADVQLCRRLIQDILPELRILDPACGSGNLLVALHQQLTEIFSILTGYIQQNQDTQLKIWRSGLAESTTHQTADQRNGSQPNFVQNIQKRILKNNLYGVEQLASKAETARLQLLLHTVATAQTQQDIEPLIDLDFNVMSGNSLVGLITVDEERFDEVNKAAPGSILQGNLLQPLAADGYQTILAEKNLALEHYKSRNQTLAQARNIPPYARAALLREDISTLDAKAQNKLDTLLLNYMSQQLGIQYKIAQLTDRPQRQPLTLKDIDVLQPFHWGYHFNAIIQRGGFDIVVCTPPWGAFKPTVKEFLQKFQDLAKAKGLSAHTLKTSKQALAKGDLEVTQAWLFYQDQYAYVTDYFYHSEQYTYQNPTSHGKLVRNQLSRERLFVEQCFNLLSPNGIAAVTLPQKLSEQAKAKTLFSYLKENAQCDELVDRVMEVGESIFKEIEISILRVQRHYPH